MKKFLFVGTMAILLLKAGVVQAHPPGKIELSYDAKEHILTVKIDHVTNNTLKHYIRKLTLFKNDQELDSYYFVTQSPQGLEEKIPLEAKSKDNIRVKAICKQAGYLEQTLTIP